MPSLADSSNLLSLFADATRVRLLALLAAQELSVAELTAVTQLPQSRVSTHLGKLREAELLRDRRAGASTYYALNDGAMPDDAKKLWSLLQGELDDDVLASDRARAAKVVSARDKAGHWPDPIAGEMERHYSPGRTWEALARGLVGLLRLGEVLDVGCGDGAVAQLLAPEARAYTCLDPNERLLAAARDRLGAAFPEMRFVAGDVSALPFDEARFDEVLLFHVLTHVADPGKALKEVARVLRPRGRLVVLTLAEHAHEAATAAYHHQHPGFRPAPLKKQLQRAGLTVTRCEITSRERREPHFEVISAFAEKV